MCFACQLAINEVSIMDMPRFSFRGTMIDTARHYLPLDTISTSEHLHVNLECPQSILVTPSFSSSHITHTLCFHSKILIGASLSKPHTSLTSLHLCVCVLGPTTYHTSLLALCLFCVICLPLRHSCVYKCSTTTRGAISHVR